jgi:sugar O-acyltransferase (sialic acid O-acetyltransferase NeuD family)
MNFVLVGAGGHAKALVEVVRASGGTISRYVDRKEAAWLDAPHTASDDVVDPAEGSVLLGIGGVTPDELERRLALFDRYVARGFRSEPVRHPAAWVSTSAELAAGVVVLAGAVVQPHARIGRGAIINSGAIVEHDSVVGDGSHVAPGAIVLGACRIGRCCMIGAGSVILPEVEVADRSLVAAGTRRGHDAAKAGETR